MYVKGGRENTGLDAIAWAKQVVECGAGELLLTSMDGDGTQKGYDPSSLPPLLMRCRCR